MKRSTSILTATLVAAAVALSGSAASASDRDRDDQEARGNRPVYLAIGDSLAAGQQSAPPATSVEETAALWKASGFVAQFHDTLQEDLDCRPDRRHDRDDDRGDRHSDDRRDRRDRNAKHRDGCPDLQLVNLSRTGLPGVPGSGVTTATVLAEGDQLDRAVALLEQRNGDRSPRNDVEVVSVTVGGNDLFGVAVAACVSSPDPAATCAPALAKTFAGFAVRYDQILAELRTAGGEDLLLLTTTYYNPLPFCDLGATNPGATALGNVILEGGTLPGLGTLDAGFNDVIRGISGTYGATAVDTFGALGAADFVGGADCLHPDADGHRVIADIFAAAFPG